MRYKQSCSSNERISKETVLAMLQAPSILGVKPGELVEYIDTHGRTTQNRVVKVGRDNVTLIGPDGNFEVDMSAIKKNNPPVFLDKLSYDQWSITSFDPSTRVVCIAITTHGGIRNITVTLPLIDTNNRLSY